MGWLSSLEVGNHPSAVLAGCEMDNVGFDCGLAADVLGDFNCFGLALHEILPGTALHQNSNLK